MSIKRSRITAEQRQALRWLADMMVINEIQTDVFSKIDALKGRRKEMDRYMQKSWPEPYDAWRVFQEERKNALKDGLDYCKREGFVVPKGSKKKIVKDCGFDPKDPIEFPIYLKHDESECVVKATTEEELDGYLADGAVEISEEVFYKLLDEEDLGL